MRQLSVNGQQAVNDLAQRHGFSPDAVTAMLEAVINGNGGMAQFSHTEFGGSGQWMRGGMTMTGDMFNGTLKGRVDSLCSDLAQLVVNQPGLLQTGSFQSQSQNGQYQNGQQQYGSPQQGQYGQSNSLFVPGSGGGGSSTWWPSDLGWPNSTGAQNNVRYAYFAQSCRLAIDLNGTITVYDTQDHNIGGFSQQQSYDGSVNFTSQYGLVNVGALPVISSNGTPPSFPQQFYAPLPAPSALSPTGSDGDIFATIERLAGLRGKGILSDQEFDAKKAELLGRL